MTRTTPITAVIPSETSPREVASVDEIVSAIGSWVIPETVNRMMEEDIDRVRSVLALTPLNGITNYSDILLSGREGLTSEISPSERCQKFASDVESVIVMGIIPVEKRIFGGFKIDFGDDVTSGTGCEAAKLVGAAISANGVPCNVKGSVVVFHPSREQTPSVLLLKNVVETSADSRRALVASL